ncbi:SusD/RagB family nutrient-binding outer membrane lipoprotein [Flavobacterium sp. LS1R47]|uniref:SusD/RagB family nutrient-binding outer membrane lipoprotein n=1 Tax=Flavobacterium frigoritolerans TaxID=2987686 RepID=A0A9X3C5X1_9FLAO|nr:SusD/RagB family nutrient-binding outer membrane lipoprotein [Flavobacterium frigoritolerans]MCV9931079.1 SusD/RagB family nutrient-binding outer membrane lipoprotein [Flavobacterium frigoritolerans]
MKKYIKGVILTVFSITLLNSCQSELDDFNNNPNNPSVSTPTLLMAAMEVSTFSTHTTGLMRYSGIFTQHLAGTNIGQMGPIASYIITEGDVNNEWNLIYGTTLMNGHILNRDFAKDYPYYNGIGQILTALNLGYATDMWGDVPYDESFLAEQGNKAPKYNTQQEIYVRLQAILDNAIINLAKPIANNEKIPGKDDLIFAGDTKKWIKVAYVLKARFALRLTVVEGNAAAQKALDYITLAGMTENADDANTFFTTETNSLNQWYAFGYNRPNYMKVGKYLVDYLKNTNDPRLSKMIALTVPPKNAPVGFVPDYIGNAPEDQTSIGTSYIGSAFASEASQIGIVTYAEAKFIEAEAKARLGQSGVDTALQEAVTASVRKITSTDPTAPFLAAATADITIAGIIQQKYIALFLTMEPYNDFRRTGFPVLVPNQNSQTRTIPVRLPTPSDERQYNPNATVVSNVTSKIWWDKD